MTKFESEDTVNTLNYFFLAEHVVASWNKPHLCPIYLLYSCISRTIVILLPRTRAHRNHYLGFFLIPSLLPYLFNNVHVGTVDVAIKLLECLLAG